jgi:hypothetical protein
MVSPRSAEAGASTCGKLKRLHVDPVPKHRMMDGSFWNTTGDLVKPFQGEGRGSARMSARACLCTHHVLEVVLAWPRTAKQWAMQ